MGRSRWVVVLQLPVRRRSLRRPAREASDSARPAQSRTRACRGGPRREPQRSNPDAVLIHVCAAPKLVTQRGLRRVAPSEVTVVDTVSRSARTAVQR